MTLRKRLWTFGARPNTVAVFEETLRGERLVRVQWRHGTQRLTKSWPSTGPQRKEAKAFAEQLAAEFQRPLTAPAELSLRELWDAYTAAEFDTLRPKTVTNYRQHWRTWEVFADRMTVADVVSRETVDRFRQELRRRGIAVSQIRKMVELVKRVYRFGVDRDLVKANRLTDYQVKIGKDERRAPTAEYRPDEALKVMAQLDPRKRQQWRAWLFCQVAYHMGARTNAILHLQWTDVAALSDVNPNEWLTWRAQWDKTGRERKQPAPRQVIEGLLQATLWRHRDRYLGPWVFYTPKRAERGDQPVTYRAIWWQLARAEERAGVAHMKWNAMHRFRRTAFGNVRELAGFEAAMEWIGDTSVKAAQVYNKSRSERMTKVAESISATETQPGSEGYTVVGQLSPDLPSQLNSRGGTRTPDPVADVTEDPLRAE